MKIFESSGRAAVVIPLYKESLSDSEEFSLRNTLDVLGRHDIYVIGPERLSGYLETYKKREGFNFRLALYKNKFFDSINGYNSLMKSKHFYESFSNYEYILILQTDALVFSDQLDIWCDRNYSYVGAPWFVGHDKPEKPLVFLGVGNGGFSLRKVEDFIKVLSVPRHVPYIAVLCDKKRSLVYRLVRKFIYKFVFAYNRRPLMPRVNEDAFWGMLVPRCCQFFKVPEVEEAASFAFEVEPRYLYVLNNRQLPFGCHAWEKYDSNFWEQVMCERGMKLPP